MKVFRVETLAGEGPYARRLLLPNEVCRAISEWNSYQHPSPEDDIPEWENKKRKDLIFGFKTLNLLKLWFSYIKDYAEHFQVVEYETEVWLEGDHQIAFIPKEKLNVFNLKEII